MTLFANKHHNRLGSLSFQVMATICILFMLCFNAQASKVYQQPADFVKQQFGGAPPAPQLQTLCSTMKQRIQQMNGKQYCASRIRYWKKGNRVVYILDDIGKTRPITIGYVVENNRIISNKVLIYRESHGSEVSRGYFNKQLNGVSLTSKGSLSKDPRNIAGATLSVRTMKRTSRIALYLQSLL